MGRVRRKAYGVDRHCADDQAGWQADDLLGDHGRRCWRAKRPNPVAVAWLNLRQIRVPLGSKANKSSLIEPFSVRKRLYCVIFGTLFRAY